MDPVLPFDSTGDGDTADRDRRINTAETRHDRYNRGSSGPRFVPRMVVNNVKPASAEPLVAALQAIGAEQSREAFAQFFEHFAPRVKAYFQRLGADAGSAEELTQDVMLTVWRRAATYDAKKAAPSTWVFTIARNRYIDVKVRKNGGAQFVPVDDLWPVLEAEQASTPEQAELLLRGAELRQSMQTLPPAQAEVIEKAFFEDKTHQEIADELGVPVGTVKSRIRLALQRLSAIFVPA